jgi:hypothetical protein
LLAAIFSEVLSILFSSVDEYDVGPAGQGIDTEGKLPTTWVPMKTEK